MVTDVDTEDWIRSGIWLIWSRVVGRRGRGEAAERGEMRHRCVCGGGEGGGGGGGTRGYI
jgi:hypothetical protein